MEQALTVVEQREVDFYGDELIAVRAEDGQIYVSLRHLCAALGIDTQGQARRIKRQPVLDKGHGLVDILSTQPAPQHRRSQVLRVDLVPLFLTGINTRSIGDAADRAKLERFQEEAAKVLWQAFQEGRLTAEPSFDDLLAGASAETVQAFQVAQAVLQLARNQVLLEARLRGVLDDHETRLEAVEAQLRLDSARYITEDQASQISQAVKAVAVALGKKSGRNEFGGVGSGDTAWRDVSQVRHQRLQDAARPPLRGSHALAGGLVRRGDGAGGLAVLAAAAGHLTYCFTGNNCCSCAISPDPYPSP